MPAERLALSIPNLNEEAGIMAQVLETGTSSLKKESVKRGPFAGNHRRRAPNLRVRLDRTCKA